MTANRPSTDAFARAFGVAVLLIVCLLPQINLSATTPPSTDEAMWAHMAWRWRQFGEPPLAYTYDNKPPAVYEVFYVGQMLGLGPVQGARLIGLLARTLSALLIYSLGRRWGGHVAGCGALVLFLLLGCLVLMDGAYIAHTEVFLVLLALTAITCCARAAAPATPRRGHLWLIAAGACVGFSTLGVKQMGLCTTISVVCFRLLTRRGKVGLAPMWIDAACLASGAAIGGAVALGPSFAAGVTPNQYFGAVWGSISHASTMRNDLLARLAVLGRVWLCTELVVVILGTVLFAAQGRSLRSRGVPTAALAVWVVLAMATANASGNQFGHQYRQALAPLSLVAALGFVRLLERYASPVLAGRWRATAVLAAAVWLLMPHWMLHLISNGRPVEIGRQSVDEHREAGRWIRENSRPEDYVFIHGADAQSIQMWARRRSPTVHFTGFFLDVPGARQAVRRGIERNGPAWIVLAPPGSPEAITDPRWKLGPWFEQMLDERYEPAHVSGDYVFYRPKTGPSE